MKRNKRYEDYSELMRVEDPLLHFELKAVEVGRSIGIEPSIIKDTCDILQGAFSTDWLIEQTRTYDKGDEMLAKACQHPLGSIVGIAGRGQIAEACELALYLKQLVRVPGLSAVIKHVKKNHNEYETSLLQLAFAYRFQSIGADEIELEPPVAGGRLGDLAFRLHGACYIAECYVPRSYPRLPEDIGELRAAMPAMLNSIDGEDDDTYRVLLVRPKRVLGAFERKRVVAIAAKLSKEVISSPKVVFEDDAVALELRQIPFSDVKNYLPYSGNDGEMELYAGAAACLASSEISKDELLSWHKRGIEVPERHQRNIVLVWNPPSTKQEVSLEAWFNDIRNKISTKIVQARRHDNPRRLSSFS